MTAAPDLQFAAEHPNDARTIASVSAAHFVSHVYILLLPPLFEVIRADYQVSYTELGLALVAFNALTAAFQTPAGFLVDHVGARIVLICGLLLGSAAVIVAGVGVSFWVFVAMFALAGLGNAVYHPADYAMLSDRVASERIGRAFSIHTFSGMLGGAVAPGLLLFLYGYVGWRGAFVATAMLGLAVAGVLALQRDTPLRRDHLDPVVDANSGNGQTSLRLLLSPVILLNFVFFALFAFTNGGLITYSVVALSAAHGVPLAEGNLALSGYLLLNAAGVLLGGLLLGRASPVLVTVACMLAFAVLAVVLGLYNLGTAATVIVMSLSGLAAGMAMPSRDMMVRAVTPPGSFGKVFGFVTTGFNFAGVLVPLCFGPLMDHGYPVAVFMVIAATSLAAVAIIFSARTNPTVAAPR
jgi:FSR family fosmidomycin resistance protein-like MFS transporter